MGQRRVSAADIQVGAALPFDVYAPNGKLLLKHGQILNHQSQIDRLIQDGFLVDDDRVDGRPPPERLHPAAAEAPPSVVQQIRQAFHRLQQAVLQLHSDPAHFEPRIREAAGLIDEACHRNRDVALALISLQRDERYALSHSLNTAIVCCVVAQGMRLDPDACRAAVCASLTMNLSMLELQDELQRQESPLNDAQRAAVEGHPRESEALLRDAGVGEAAWLEAVLQHHEQSDGSGYPCRLQGERICTAARLVHLADIYTARITPRAYRGAVQGHVALRDIFLERGKAVDPELAARFIKDVGIYPPGTLVRLVNGEVGVVSHQTDKTNTPMVHALIGPRGAALACAIRRNTADERYAIRSVVDAQKLDIRINMALIWGKEAA